MTKKEARYLRARLKRALCLLKTGDRHDYHFACTMILADIGALTTILEKEQ